VKRELFLGVSCAAIVWVSLNAFALAADTAPPGASPAPSASRTESISVDSKSADPCITVASAKFEQWNQPRFMIHRTETFSDGSKKEIEAIFTEDAAYGHDVGLPWETENIVRKERVLPPPDVLVKRMGLTDCQLAGPAQGTKQPSSLFTYDYFPDEHASQVAGKMSIADSSNLPLLQELSQEPETNRKVAVRITSTFAYGDDVQVPNGAIQSNNFRRWLEQQGFLSNTLIIQGAGTPPIGQVNRP
jgi:hypothetical protein